jgi:hypothetical protein
VLKTRLTKRRTLTLGHARFTIAPGKTARVVVKISKRGRKLVAQKRRPWSTVASRDGGDDTGPDAQAVIAARTGCEAGSPSDVAGSSGLSLP